MVRAAAQEPEEPAAPLAPLNTVPVPKPSKLGRFIEDMDAARVLGKALFWDMQVGGDGRTACGTCHFHAGTDARTTNTLGVRGSQFEGTDHASNRVLTPDDFPFHRLADPADRNSEVTYDTTDVVGGQGVIMQLFRDVRKGNPVDKAKVVPDPVFNINGVNARQVTGRNTPTMINAVFNDRQFWDGRANRFFNGVNPFGDQDPDARVWKLDGKKLKQVRILLDNASLASQAVGPPNNNVEMSFDGRTFPELGKKLLSMRPLALQRVHPDDSVLGPYARKGSRGLTVKHYSDLIRKAFDPEWWDGPDPVDGEFSHMEANFSLFWGLALNVYMGTLVSDDSPFDRFAAGDQDALTDQQKEGLDLFIESKCNICHSGPVFTEASVFNIRGPDGEGPIELRDFEIGPQAFTDEGFRNIGVRSTDNDLGIGRTDLPFGTVSLTRRLQNGDDLERWGIEIESIAPDMRTIVDGAFKVPSLRNVELTGPYFHNGGMKSLTEVVQFYARGSDFRDHNIDNLSQNVSGLEDVRGNPDKIEAIVAFLKSLTDERVRRQQAPFDHPEIIVPNGHSGVKHGVALDDNVVIPAVGADGSSPLPTFEEILNGAPLSVP